MADLKLVSVVIMAAAVVAATGHRRQEMESTWGAQASDGDVVPDEESEGSIMDLFNFFEEMSKMFDAMSTGEEQEGHKTETTPGGEATEEETETVNIAVPHQPADKYQDHEEQPGALQRVKRLRRSRFRKEQEMESTWGAGASDGDVVPDEESEGSIMDLFNFFEEMSKMFDAMSPGEEKEGHIAETTSGGEATEEETGTVDIAAPQEADKYQDHEEHRMKRMRQSRFRKRGVKQWFCGKLVDSSEERPRGKRGVREKLWQMFCIPGPASVSSASSSSDEWRPPKHG